MSRFLVITKASPEGVELDGWKQEGLDLTLGDLSDSVMGRPTKSNTYRAVAFRALEAYELADGTKAHTGLFVERFTDDDTPEGLVRLSGRAVLHFSSREGFGSTLAVGVLAIGENGHSMQMANPDFNRQLLLGMLRVAAFDMNEVLPLR